MGRAIEAEIHSARESIDLTLRRPNYFKNVLGLYALSFYGIERSRIMRASYLPIRKVDDALDGDAPKIKDPLQYAENLRSNIANHQLGKTPEERLLQYSLDALEQKAKPNDDPRGDFVKAIEEIMFDYARTTERRLLSAEQIEKYYRDAFDPVINITLLAIDSKLRSKDIPALSYGQGRVYSARDFQEDWERGMINVPDNVIYSAGLTSHSSFEEVEASGTVTDWFHKSLAATKPDLIRAQLLLTELVEPQTYAVCNGLISSMLKFIETSSST